MQKLLRSCPVSKYDKINVMYALHVRTDKLLSQHLIDALLVWIVISLLIYELQKSHNRTGAYLPFVVVFLKSTTFVKIIFI